MTQDSASSVRRYAFASDNTAGLCSEALEAIPAANAGSVASYGDDRWTADASDLFREIFECECEVFFVFNGTAANSLALASLCESYHSVICHETSHVETDECGAPEFFSNGTKLLLARGEHGKLTPAGVEALVLKRQDIHYPRPRALSLSQPTELGTVYKQEEIADLTAKARSHGLKTHMDGARFAHALVTLGCSPADITWKAGVDVLCFGGTKLGIGFGEAILFFDRSLAAEFAWRCKQAGQLASKMRFLAAPWQHTLSSGGWLKNAENANRCALILEKEIRSIPGIDILYRVEANSVFVRLPESVHEQLQARGWVYYVFIGGGARLMCSWATSDADINSFLSDLREIVSADQSSKTAV